MGEVRVPARAKWRAQTQRAVENFPISGRPLEPAHLHALAQIKAAAAKVNARARRRSTTTRRGPSRPPPGTSRAASWDAEFPIDVFQTGSGTSSNMNANEVIASLASERARPRRAPERRRQRLAVEQRHLPHERSTSPPPRAWSTTSCPALETLRDALQRKASEFADVVKSGRTHLMDAAPVTLGQEFGGYAAQVGYGIERLQATLPRVAELPLGGTAVGTGINTPPGFAAAGHRRARRRHRAAVDRGPQPLRGPGQPGLPGRAVRPAAHHRRRAGQDLHRHPLDGLRPAAPGWARSGCPTCSPGRASCRARSTRSSPRPRRWSARR